MRRHRRRLPSYRANGNRDRMGTISPIQNTSGRAGMSKAPDVIVIGAGLHGCSAALHLARRGRRVLVIEKNTAGRHASGVNAGGVRRLGRHPAEIPLSVASLELWHRIRELVDDDCGFQATGHIKLAESADDMAILEERASQVRCLGFEHEEMVDQAEARRLVPAAAPHITGGLISRRDVGSAIRQPLP